MRLDQLRLGRAHPRRYRNRRLGEFLKELKFTEGRSTGIPKILEAMARNGSPPPEFEFDADYSYFMVRLPVHPTALEVANSVQGDQLDASAGTRSAPSRHQVEILQQCGQERTLADLMKKHTAGRGYAGRWGGDEFLIILPGSTLETAEMLSIHMKDALLHAHVLPDDSPVSASFGVTIARLGELEQSFYKRVDNALYTSKENGKNRITIFDANGTAKALTVQETGD